MSKKLNRYQGEKISEALDQFNGKFVNLVLKDNSVYFVKILKQKENKLKAMNQMNKKQSFFIDQIAEVLVDVEA